MEYLHSRENKECRVPCLAPVAAAGNCASGLAKGSAPNIEVGVPFLVGHHLVQCDTCSPHVALVFANPSSRSSFSQTRPWAAEPPEG
eukprot:5336176-Pyramimonas_sp.AAC.1